jgi:hypothetical protein
LDVPSLIEQLSNNYREHIRKIDWQQSRLIKNDEGGIQSLVIDGSPDIEIQAQRYIVTSGSGARKLLKESALAQSNPIEMQLRPLQMTVVKHRISDPIYAHCVADQLTTTPEVTLTSHRCKDGDWAWYLGGELAEAGANRSEAEQIMAAKQKIAELFPWCNLDSAQWHSFFINRAEAKQKDGRRPENASLLAHDNLFVCWPSKLTLAPALANDVTALLQKSKICPSLRDSAEKENSLSPLSCLPFPGIATTPWDMMSA